MLLSTPYVSTISRTLQTPMDRTLTTSSCEHVTQKSGPRPPTIGQCHSLFQLYRWLPWISVFFLGLHYCTYVSCRKFQIMFILDSEKTCGPVKNNIHWSGWLVKKNPKRDPCRRFSVNMKVLIIDKNMEL